MSKLLLSSVLPLAKSLLKSVDIDSAIRDFKHGYSGKLNEGEFLGILETTEADGGEYIHIIAYTSIDNGFRIMDTMKVTDLITKLISNNEYLGR